jgi:YVTN family beta-propeller protein
MRVRGILASAIVALGGVAFAAAPAGAQGPFHVEHIWQTGGDGGWDYMSVDPRSKLLFITRGDHVIVFNTAEGKQVAEIPGLHGIHCVVFSSDGIHGYITDGGANQVAVFNRKTEKIVARIPVGNHPDGEVFEPVTKTVWAFDGGSHDATVIDTKTNKVIATIPLPGRPEFPVADGRGHVFDNIESTSQLARLDAKTLKLTATWPLAPCDGPSGLSIDPAHRRLFSVCDNQTMAVVDADTGRVVTTLAIGTGPDASRFTADGEYALSTNGGTGTLTVVHEDSADHYSVVQTLTTKQGARTMAIDPDGRHLYTVTADFGPPAAPTPQHPHPRRTIVPGTFEIIAIGR